MATTITCKTCGDTRRAAYKNTLYCVKCALLRDLLYVKDRRYDCENCDRRYAPVATRDPYCGHCAFGCNAYAECVLCQMQGVSDIDGYHELHRSNVPICVRCLRDPALRRKIITSLRNGQRDRQRANNHVMKEAA